MIFTEDAIPVTRSLIRLLIEYTDHHFYSYRRSERHRLLPTRTYRACFFLHKKKHAATPSPRSEQRARNHQLFSDITQLTAVLRPDLAKLMDYIFIQPLIFRNTIIFSSHFPPVPSYRGICPQGNQVCYININYYYGGP